MLTAPLEYFLEVLRENAELRSHSKVPSLVAPSTDCMQHAIVILPLLQPSRPEFRLEKRRKDVLGSPRPSTEPTT